MFGNNDTDHNIENIPSTYICGICNEIFNEKKDFEEHIVSHWTKSSSVGNNGSEQNQTDIKLSRPKQITKEEGQNSFQCKTCHKEYIDESTKLEQVNNSEQILYCCSACNEKFKAEVSLKENEQLQSEEELYKCVECSQSLESHFDFDRHKKTVHNKAHFECDINIKAIKTEEILDGHSPTEKKEPLDASNSDSKATFIFNSGNSTEMYKESSLPEVTIKKEEQELAPFHTNQKIQNRIKLLNKKSKYVCDVCNKSCISNYSLKEHKLIHNGERPHKCETCFCKFRFHYDLIKHQLIHEEPSCECKICPKVYASKNSLRKHFFASHAQKSHGGFNCSFCEKQLSTHDSLWQHYLDHVVIYPFKCKVCSKKFETRFDLKTHAKTHPNPLSEIC
ncbi:Zinc finger protein 345 like protein [Argiope bruennichi]|uniref:Zinc finger protein 345 like protein n=1 Tax=Argiope bruennichi TaxID=94029 RepID=A0A8T0FHE2_ARGBR|nr:Zinc finger protein 345 like protein [Argiope bruennichi]